MPPSATPSPPSPGPWRNFWIAGAAVFRVRLDTTAVVAACAPLRIHFIGASVASLGPARFGAGGGISNALRQMVSAIGAARAVASMGQHRGLLGYAARRQLFGNQGWTMSVWTDDDARAAFVRSAVHREAMAKSQPALVAVELRRMTVARRDLPADWAAVLRQLADPAGLRNYAD